MHASFCKRRRHHHKLMHTLLACATSRHSPNADTTVQDAQIGAGQPRHVLSAAAGTAAAGKLIKCAFQPASGSGAPLLAACSGDVETDVKAPVCVWDSGSGALRHRFEPGTRAVPDIAWSPCGTLLAATALDRTLRVWSVGTGALALQAPLPEAALAVAWPAAGRVCVGMVGGSARVLAVRS